MSIAAATALTGKVFVKSARKLLFLLRFFLPYKGYRELSVSEVAFDDNELVKLELDFELFNADEDEDEDVDVDVEDEEEAILQLIFILKQLV